jgi:hypothetical protein
MLTAYPLPFPIPLSPIAPVPGLDIPVNLLLENRYGRSYSYKKSPNLWNEQVITRSVV